MQRRKEGREGPTETDVSPVRVDEHSGGFEVRQQPGGEREEAAGSRLGQRARIFWPATCPFSGPEPPAASRAARRSQGWTCHLNGRDCSRGTASGAPAAPGGEAPGRAVW